MSWETKSTPKPSATTRRTSSNRKTFSLFRQEHGGFVQHKHAAALIVLTAVLAQLLSRTHDREQRLGGGP